MPNNPEWAVAIVRNLEDGGCYTCDDHTQVPDEQTGGGRLVNDPQGCTWEASCAQVKAIASALVEVDRTAYERGVKDAVKVAERFGVEGSVIGAMLGLGVVTVEEERK